MRSSSLIDSFRHAFDGVLHVFRTQRHMRFHFFMVVVVLTLAKIYDLNRTELLVLFFSICFVLISEMFNTAVEAVIDMITQSYHPLAKHAKDVTAGAVLIASINSMVVGYLLFLDDGRLLRLLHHAHPNSPVSMGRAAVIEVVILLVVLVALRVLGNGKDPRRNPISGHSALAFSLATVTVLITQPNVSAAIFVVLLAGLVAHSRMERGLHDLRAVCNGALLGIFLPVILLRLLP